MVAQISDDLSADLESFFYCNADSLNRSARLMDNGDQSLKGITVCETWSSGERNFLETMT